MPYVTGAAVDFNALKSAIVAACISNGWTLSDSVLHKSGAYVSLTALADKLAILGGTGIDGSNALTGAATAGARMGLIGAANVLFPATYHLHVHTAPDEVYLVVNYNVEFWQWLAFGISDVVGLAGTGCWFGASWSDNALDGLSLNPESGGSNGGTNPQAGALFFQERITANARIHHGFDGLDWSSTGGSTGTNPNAARAGRPAAPKYARQPNAWNSSDALIEYQVYVRRESDKQSLVADLGHARLVRIDNHTPGDLVPDSAPEWKVYPWFRKDITARDGGNNILHSGTLGIAIRYDGP